MYLPAERTTSKDTPVAMSKTSTQILVPEYHFPQKASRPPSKNGQF